MSYGLPTFEGFPGSSSSCPMYGGYQGHYGNPSPAEWSPYPRSNSPNPPFNNTGTRGTSSKPGNRNQALQETRPIPPGTTPSSLATATGRRVANFPKAVASKAFDGYYGLLKSEAFTNARVSNKYGLLPEVRKPPNRSLPTAPATSMASGSGGVRRPSK